MVNGVDLAGPSADGCKAARKRFAGHSDDVGLPAPPVSDHADALVADVLDSVRAYGEFAGDCSVEDRRQIGFAVFEADRDIGRDHVVEPKFNSEGGLVLHECVQSSQMRVLTVGTDPSSPSDVPWTGAVGGRERVGQQLLDASFESRPGRLATTRLVVNIEQLQDSARDGDRLWAGTVGGVWLRPSVPKEIQDERCNHERHSRGFASSVIVTGERVLVDVAGQRLPKKRWNGVADLTCDLDLCSLEQVRVGKALEAGRLPVGDDAVCGGVEVAAFFGFEEFGADGW